MELKEPKKGKIVVRESKIEDELCKRAKKLNMIPYKFSSPGRASVPDRMVLAPFGGLGFVELKRPGGKCTPAQLREHERIRALGHKVYVCDNFDQIDEILYRIQSGI